MTAKVRIEKADNTPYLILSQVQMVNADGNWVNDGEPKLLQFAAQQIEEHIHQNKRVIVFEFPTGNA